MSNIYVLEMEGGGGVGRYDGAVVVADSEAEAMLMHPDGNEWWDGRATWSWPDCEEVKARLVGVTVDGMEKGVVLSSMVGIA